MKPYLREIKFLLSSARVLRSQEDISRIKSCFRKDLDWDYITKQSLKHQIAPLLYYNLKKLKIDKGIPSQAIWKLRVKYIQTLYTNLILQQELLSIQKKLEELNIQAIPLRGVFLSKILYQDLIPRTMLDIDYLVKEEDFPQFEELIYRLGYQKLKLAEEEENYFRKWGSNLVFSKAISSTQRVLLEAHWTIVPPRPYKVELPIWERLTFFPINGQRVKVPSPEDNFIFLALHLRNHTRSLLLKHLVDIAEWLRIYQNQIDWDYIIAQARKQKVSSLICFALLASHILLDVPLPSEAKEFLKLYPGRARIYSWLSRPARFFNYLSQRNFTQLWGLLLRLFLLEHLYEIFSYPVMLRILKELKLAK